MKKTKGQTRNDSHSAAGFAILIVLIEVITEFTGIRKYKLNPEPKTIIEVLSNWPIYLVSGLVTFLFVYWWNSRMNQKQNN